MSKKENGSYALEQPEQEVASESSLAQFWRVLLQKLGRENSENPEPPFSLVLFGEIHTKIPSGTSKIIEKVEKRLADPHRGYEDDTVRRHAEELVYSITYYAEQIKKNDLEGLYNATVSKDKRVRMYLPNRVSQIVPQKEAIKALSAGFEMLRERHIPYLNENITRRSYIFKPTKDKEVQQCVIFPATESTPSLSLEVNFFTDSFDFKKAEFSLVAGDTLDGTFRKRLATEAKAKQEQKIQRYVDALTDPRLTEALFFNIDARRVSLGQTEFRKTFFDVLHLDHFLDRFTTEAGEDINSEANDPDDLLEKNQIKEDEVTVFVNMLMAALPTLQVDSKENQLRSPHALARLRDRDHRFTLVFQRSEHPQMHSYRSEVEVVLYFSKDLWKEKQTEALKWFEEHYPLMLDEVKKQKVEKGLVDVEEELEQALIALVDTQEWGDNQTDVYLTWGTEFLERKIKELLAASI